MKSHDSHSQLKEIAEDSEIIGRYKKGKLLSLYAKLDHYLVFQDHCLVFPILMSYTDFSYGFRKQRGGFIYQPHQMRTLVKIKVQLLTF